jgi:hypothetical protein
MIGKIKVAPAPSESRCRGAWRVRCCRCSPGWQYFADRAAAQRWARWHDNWLHERGSRGVADWDRRDRWMNDEDDARRRARILRNLKWKRLRRWWQAWWPPLVLAVLVGAAASAITAAALLDWRPW